ncbi:unnamed protein product, partial [Laminaria digitata]
MSALAAPACAFAPPPSVFSRHPCGGCPLSRVAWPRIVTGGATLGQNNRNKRKRPNNYGVYSIKSSIGVGSSSSSNSSSKSKAWQAVPYRSSRTLAEKIRNLTEPRLTLLLRHAGEHDGEVFSGAANADADA